MSNILKRSRLVKYSYRFHSNLTFIKICCLTSFSLNTFGPAQPWWNKQTDITIVCNSQVVPLCYSISHFSLTYHRFLERLFLGCVNLHILRMQYDSSMFIFLCKSKTFSENMHISSMYINKYMYTSTSLGNICIPDNPLTFKILF